MINRTSLSYVRLRLIPGTQSDADPSQAGGSGAGRWHGPVFGFSGAAVFQARDDRLPRHRRSVPDFRLFGPNRISLGRREFSQARIHSASGIPFHQSGDSALVRERPAAFGPSTNEWELTPWLSAISAARSLEAYRGCART
jgi:hypothetical protein